MPAPVKGYPAKMSMWFMLIWLQRASFTALQWLLLLGCSYFLLVPHAKEQAFMIIWLLILFHTTFAQIPEQCFTTENRLWIIVVALGIHLLLKSLKFVFTGMFYKTFPCFKLVSRAMFTAISCFAPDTTHCWGMTWLCLISGRFNASTKVFYIGVA